jgi:hypothetical protein
VEGKYSFWKGIPSAVEIPLRPLRELMDQELRPRFRREFLIQLIYSRQIFIEVLLWEKKKHLILSEGTPNFYLIGFWLKRVALLSNGSSIVSTWI